MNGLAAPEQPRPLAEIAGREIIAVTGDEPDTGTVTPRHDAEAVVLDFVQPSGTRGRSLSG